MSDDAPDNRARNGALIGAELFVLLSILSVSPERRAEIRAKNAAEWKAVRPVVWAAVAAFVVGVLVASNAR